jgi:heme-degrading monooxygenase HmoA
VQRLGRGGLDDALLVAKLPTDRAPSGSACLTATGAAVAITFVAWALASYARAITVSREDIVIVRAWHATATPEGADAYREHFTHAVLPVLQPIDGYRGAYLLRRDDDGHVELQVLTMWDSMEAIRRFAGVDLDRAVVEPEAQAALASYSTTVTHHSIVVDALNAATNAGTDQ